MVTDVKELLQIFSCSEESISATDADVETSYDTEIIPLAHTKDIIELIELWTRIKILSGRLLK